MIHTNTYTKVTEVKQAVKAFIVGFSKMYDCKYIASDYEISLEYSFGDFLKYPYGRYYFAVREMGTEGGEKAKVQERCKALGSPVAACRIEKIDSQLWEVVFKTI